MHSQPLKVSHFHNYKKEKENRVGRTEYDENVLFLAGSLKQLRADNAIVTNTNINFGSGRTQ